MTLPTRDRVVDALTVATIGAAVMGVCRPTVMSGVPADVAGQRYYAGMYAARAVPLGLGVLAARLRGQDRALLLLVASAAQVGDAAIGLCRRSPGQTVAPLVAAALFALGARPGSAPRSEAADSW